MEWTGCVWVEADFQTGRHWRVWQCGKSTVRSTGAVAVVVARAVTVAVVARSPDYG